MKKMKKFLSMLLAVIMVLAMAVPSFAAKITVENATNGETYSIYKIFEATRGTGDAISYTATPAQQAWFTQQANNPFAFSRNATTGNYYVTVAENGNVKEFLQALVEKDSDTGKIIFKNGKSVEFDGKTLTRLSDVMGAATTVKGIDSKAEFDNLEYGYYLVTSSLGAIITLDSSNTDVKVIDKNQDGPSWGKDGYKGITKVHNDAVTMKVVNLDDDKTISIPNDKASANYGDVVEFEIMFHTTNYKGENRIAHYYVDDKLAAGMEFNAKTSIKPEDFVVKVGTTPLTKGSDYTVTFNETNNSFELVIDWYNEDTQKHKYTSPNTITVTYTATVKDTAAIAGVGNANEANFTYTTLDKDGNESEKPSTGSETKKATIYVYALGINKTDKSGNGLEGAEFALTDNSGAAVNVHLVSSESTVDVNVYAYGTLEGETKSNIVVSPKNGYIVIKGIEAGTYKMKETKAPNGYNLLATEESLTANLVEVQETELTKTVYYNANGELISKEEYDELIEEIEDDSVTVRPVEKTVSTVYPMEAASFKAIVNFAGTMLPSTGGIGTTIFYVAGIILMAGAVFFVVRRRA